MSWPRNFTYVRIIDMTKQNEAQPVLRIDNIAIPLSAVSGTLRRGYELATHEVATAPAGPIQNAAKSRMNAAATQILREAAGNIALKISPKSHGAAGFYEAVNRRA
jgi:hypothetical protein